MSTGSPHGPFSDVEAVTVSTDTRLEVTYRSFVPTNPKFNDLIVMHHGIFHSWLQFTNLIEKLNDAGIHVVTIDQQSEDAEHRNFIGADQYQQGMAPTVRQIQEDLGKPVGIYLCHSMGAFIAEEMQLEHPDLRRPTAMMAPIPLSGAWPISLRLLFRHPLIYFKTVLTLTVQTLAREPWQVHELFFDETTEPETYEEVTKRLKHAPFWMYVQLILRLLIRPRIRHDGYSKLLLLSETDYIFRPKEYARTRERFREALEEHYLPGGHDFFIEHADDTAAKVIEFYKRCKDERLDQPEQIEPPHSTVSEPKKTFVSLFFWCVGLLVTLSIWFGCSQAH